MELTEIYGRYIAQVDALLEKSSAFDGVWGWGNDPRQDPCHLRFYEAVEAHLNALTDTAGEELLFQAADWIIRIPLEHEDTAVYWFMLAAQGLCRPLVSRLTPAHCAALRDFFDAAYPRRTRLPVQKELYKLLTRAAKNACQNRPPLLIMAGEAKRF